MNRIKQFRAWLRGLSAPWFFVAVIAISTVFFSALGAASTALGVIEGGASWGLIGAAWGVWTAVDELYIQKRIRSGAG